MLTVFNMKTIIFIFLISTMLSFKGKAETNSISTQTYSVVKTNWNYHTNIFEVYYGSNGQTNGVYTVNRGVDALIGTVISNQFCSVFNNNVKKQTFLLTSKVLGELKVTWQTNVVYRTNFYVNK